MSRQLRLTKVPWWKTAVFYQIYPRSFADGNGDGMGDLAGILSRLNYLRDLGVDALWLSPHYSSPQFDCGYDMLNYSGVAPEYGTLDDLRRFLDKEQRDITFRLAPFEVYLAELAESDPGAPSA